MTGQELKKVEGKLPKILLDLIGILANKGQAGKLVGPIADIMLVCRKAKEMLELADIDGKTVVPDKFLPVVMLAEFGDRLAEDHKQTWNMLAAYDQGKMADVPLPKPTLLKDEPEETPAVETEEEPNVDNPDNGGDNEA